MYSLLTGPASLRSLAATLAPPEETIVTIADELNAAADAAGWLVAESAPPPPAPRPVGAPVVISGWDHWPPGAVPCLADLIREVWG